MHGAIHLRGPGGAGFDDAAVQYDGATHPFDQVERLHLRKRLVPDFEWLDFDEPSPRNAPGGPLRDARVGLVVTGETGPMTRRTMVPWHSAGGLKPTWAAACGENEDMTAGLASTVIVVSGGSSGIGRAVAE